MKRFLCTFVGCLVVTVVSGADDNANVIQNVQLKGIIFRAKKDGKIDKDRLVGTWKAKKLAKGLVFKGLENRETWEFKKDGSVKTSVKLVSKKGDTVFELEISMDGEYELNGNKLTITIAPDPQAKIAVEGLEEITYKTTITKLTDKEFQTKDEKGNVCEFTKKTEK